MEEMKKTLNWNENPFSYKILPDYFVGYAEERGSITNGIQSGDKFILLLGPTGSGKTTLLKHVLDSFSNYRMLYLPKPPKDPQDWVSVFNSILKGGFFSFLRKGNETDLYNLSDKLNNKLNGRNCLLFVDECHEASLESLEWLRTITDQVENMTLVMAGLPIFENILKDKLETFLRRFSVRVDLGSLTQAETRELIKKRVEGVGGEDIKPFTSATLEYIHQKTGGFPRDVLKVCNELSQKAVHQGLTTIDSDFLKEAEIPSRVSLDTLESLPSRQKLIIDTLSKHGDLTPTEIVAKIQAKGDYKNKDNAIRSVNNLVRRLMSDGFVERKRIGKAYKYRLSPRYQTLLVDA